MPDSPLVRCLLTDGPSTDQAGAMQITSRALCISMVLTATACGEESAPSDSLPNGGSGGEGGSSLQKDASSVSNDDGASSPTGTGGSMQPAAEASVESGVVALPDAGGAESGEAGKVTASCAGHAYPLCLDFESGKVDAPWTVSAANSKVEEMNAAHGRYAMHMSNLHSHPNLSLHAAQMPGIKDVLWGRFYLYMDAGAPSGHGAIVRVFDMQTNWYEVGFESNSYLGNWHLLPGGVPEKYMRSKFKIPPKAWACVEFAFDGATPDMAKVWSDGAPVTFDDIAKTPTIMKAVQFTTFDIGIVFYHGTSLGMYEGDTAPSLTDMWLDDIALDTKRVGCL
jgi:hypothetical protein